QRSVGQSRRGAVSPQHPLWPRANSAQNKLKTEGVARMERSAIREWQRKRLGCAPHSASLHAGYNQSQGRNELMLSRRNFLTSTIAAGAALATHVPQKVSAQVDRRMIVDAQIHLWKAESEDWKWVPGAQPQLPVPFTIERAISMMDEAGVDRAVIVPPSWPGDRNDYALEAVKR